MVRQTLADAYNTRKNERESHPIGYTWNHFANENPRFQVLREPLRRAATLTPPPAIKTQRER